MSTETNEIPRFYVTLATYRAFPDCHRVFTTLSFSLLRQGSVFGARLSSLGSYALLVAEASLAACSSAINSSRISRVSFFWPSIWAGVRYS